MIKVSVIVPVYNVEKYIDKCLNSLINQTLKDIEIIVVNDGTKDNSQEIIDNYVKKYPKLIKSYIKENGGLSSARNYGLKHAKGKYIAFLDSDDYVEKNMYELLYNKAISNNYDIVDCNVNYIYKDKTVQVKSNIKRDTNNIKNAMLKIYPAAWNKLYKKELFKNNILFKDKVWFEDVEFLYRLFPYIKSIGHVDEYLINYVQRDGAITSTFNKKLWDYIDNWNGIIKFYKENMIYNIYKKELEYCYVRYIYATFIKRALNFINKDDYNKAVFDAISNVKTNFPNYRKNLYFYRGKKGIYLLLFNNNLGKLLYRFGGHSCQK